MNKLRHIFPDWINGSQYCNPGKKCGIQVEKYVLLLYCCWMSFAAQTQDWNPLRPNDILNYQPIRGDYISHSIWVDSIQLVDTDTIFHLNRVVKEMPHPIDFNLKWKRNQGQFLGKSVRKVSKEQYIFYDDATQFVLYPQAQQGVEWVFDTLQNLTARILRTNQVELFGITDSVKIIGLSSNQRLLISKQFGIVAFESPYSSLAVQLVGIDNLGLGQTVPKLFDFFEFDVGDQFQYLQFEEMFGSTKIERYFKWKIISKTVIPNQSREYDIQELGYQTTSTNGFPHGDTIFFSESTSLIYDISEEHFTDYYNGQLAKNFLPDLEIIDPTLNYYTPVFHFLDENGVFTKSNTRSDGEDFDRVFTLSDTSDYLIPSFALDILSLKYKVGLGQSFFNYLIFEAAGGRELVGYIKGQDTIGIVEPDEVFTNIDPITSNLAFHIFPNPTKDYLQIKFADGYLPAKITLVELQTGKVLQSLVPNNNAATLDLTSLPANLYGLRLQFGQQSVVKIVGKL